MTENSPTWQPLTGSGLEKVMRIFRTPHKFSTWYVLDRKIYGKSVFLRDHGTKTLYVVGVDGYAYSFQMWSFSVSWATLQFLVDAAMSGDAPAHGGIYRNMKMGE